MTLILLVCLTACGREHIHSWAEADCLHPRTCTECGATEGEASGHDLRPADLFSPATCRVCGYTEGEALASSFTVYGLSAAEVGALTGEEVFSCAFPGSPLPERTSTAAVAVHPLTVTDSSGETVLTNALSLRGESVVLSCAEEMCSVLAAIREKTGEDYEWRAVALELRFFGEDYLQNGFLFAPSLDNWYDADGWNSTREQDEVTEQVHGGGWECRRFTACTKDGDRPVYTLVTLEKEETVLSCTLTACFFFRVPAGYDGCVITLPGAAGADPSAGLREWAEAGALFFRLK